MLSHIRTCKLKEFPTAILQLELLEKLDLGRNPMRLETFPEGLTNLTELNTLNLSYLGIPVFHKEILEFKWLEELKLGGNNVGWQEKLPGRTKRK